MKLAQYVTLFALLFIPAVVNAKPPSSQWRAVHLLSYDTDADLDALGQNLESLAKQGINVIILEVDYNFAFKSHPELRRGTAPITPEGARRFAARCKKLNIRLIPEFQSLGHQSWKAETFPLLTVYPKFDLTPGAFPNNEGIYCREWDPLNSEVWQMVFKLMDEIIDAFQADALHVGMDEVFLLGSEQSPSTKGKDPAALFAQAVNRIHAHLVRKRRVEMLMWGDRLIDGKKYNLGEWEAATNGTAAAIDQIPKDIIICPWHYESRQSYPSVPMFIEKGFRVLPAGWKDVDATKALIEFSGQHAGPKLLGHMFTTWGVKKEELLQFPPLVEGLKLLQNDRPAGAELHYEIKHRVNAHGDEFNALARSSDGQRLFTATEKGDIIVWNIAANRVERTLRAPMPLHGIAPLSDPRELVAAGSSHQKPFKALVQKWNVETGTPLDLIGIGPDSFLLALTTDPGSGLIAATNTEGMVVVWDAATTKRIADWKLPSVPIAVALIGRALYVATVDQNILSSDEARESAIIKLNIDNPNDAPTDVLRRPGRLWLALEASPDYRLLSATYRDGDLREKTVVLNPATKAEIGSFDGPSSLWIDGSKLMLFEWLDPSEIVQVSTNGQAKSIRKLARTEADTPGRAFDLTGQVSNTDGSRVWASYRKGPGLLEFDLTTNKIKTLIGGLSGAYAVSVLTQNGVSGELLTGGGDGYVRLWKLDDLSLIREFKIAKPDYFVSDAQLVPGSRQAVVGVMRITKQPTVEPIEVMLLDLETGQQKKLFDVNWWRARIALVGNQIVYAEGDRIKFAPLDESQKAEELKLDGAATATALSANSRWLAVIDHKLTLTVFDLTTRQKKTLPIKSDTEGPIVVTNDGLRVYRIADEGTLTRWDLDTGKTTDTVLTRIREMHTRVDFMTLANDDQWLVTAGNHHDVGIFERETGRLVSYVEAGAAANYVEKVWINGNRMIVTTDTGVMYDGNLIK